MLRAGLQQGQFRGVGRNSFFISWLGVPEDQAITAVVLFLGPGREAVSLFIYIRPLRRLGRGGVLWMGRGCYLKYTWLL